MKDFTGRKLDVGDLVVVKPTGRHSWMRYGFIVSIGNRIRVKSYDKTTWHGNKELTEANFNPSSVFGLDFDGMNYEYPRGFPNELISFHRALKGWTV